MQRRQWKNLRKFRHGSWRKSKIKEVIEETRNKGRKVHFSSLMDLCHQKNSELEPHCQKYKGGVVLRGDIVKDDFLDFEDKEFEETIKNERRNLETPMAPAMPCKTCKRSKHGETVARLISILNLRVSWKPVNSQECVWKNLYQIIMRSILQEEATINYNITIWYTHLFLCLKQWRYPQQKQQGQGKAKIGEHFGVEPDKSQK